MTGAYGFVGNAVVRRLAEVGHDIVTLTHRSADAPVPELPVARVFRCDIRDRGGLREALEGVQGVCHLGRVSKVDLEW
ncbi:NAD-dependent epimerase/dehydratase family protein [Streptomyces sp. NPDC048257]|uniref:NAD-dependent epimerase/dehydratase family protein n=1 Tax=Streptomyces sp. NPDC048257 TaxID=3365526 RepID=UPI003717F3A4